MKDYLDLLTFGGNNFIEICRSYKGMLNNQSDRPFLGK